MASQPGALRANQKRLSEVIIFAKVSSFTILFIYETWLTKLSDTNDPFMTHPKNLSFVSGFKSAIKEIILLLKILGKIED